MGFLDIDEKGRVAVVRIRRPEKKNALSLDLLAELAEAARGFGRRTDIFAVVVTGTDDFFTAGMDLADPAFVEAAGASLVEKRRLMAIAPDMCRAWEEMDQATIAAVEGFCLGGGLSLCVSMDYRVMARSSYMRAPEIDWGMNMSWGTLSRLTHLVGPARAKEIIVLGEKVLAETAREWGLAQWVADDGKALETALSIAEKIAQKPFAPASMTKQTINALVTAADGLASHMDRDQFLLSILDGDFARRLEGFFNSRKKS